MIKTSQDVGRRRNPIISSPRGGAGVRPEPCEKTVGCILRGNQRTVNAVTPTVEEGWQKMAITVDSGAEVSVMPTGMVPNYKVVAPEKPSWFASATGEKMADRGEQLVPMQLNSGAIKTMPFRNTNVRKALAVVTYVQGRARCIISRPALRRIMNY